MSLSRVIPIAIAVFCAATTGVVRAGQTACLEEREGFSLRDELAALPADVDIAVGVRGLARLRETPVGSVLRGAMADPAFNDLRDRWLALSEAIGMNPQDAFDAVLGDRVLVAVRTPLDAAPDWVLITEVSPRTEWTLRKQLKVSPRTIVAGQTLYTVERGALELSFLRASGPQRAASARLLLAPAGSALFERTLRGSRVGETLDAQRHSADLLIDDPRADAVMLARLPNRDNAWVSVAGRSDHETVSFSVRATRSVAANARQASRVWDEKSAANIASDAIFAVFDTDGSALSEAAAFVEPFFPRAMLGADQDAAKGVLAGREVAMLVPTDTGMSLLAAIELLDTRRGAEIGDQAMDAMLRSFGARERGFGGIAPEAVRRVDEGAASIAWVYRAAPSRDAGPSPGWWLVTTDPDLLPSASVALLGVALDNANPAGSPRALAFARPDRLIGVLERMSLPTPPAMRSLRAVREVRWREMDSNGPTTVAEVTVRLSPDDPPPPSAIQAPARPASRRASPGPR